MNTLASAGSPWIITSGAATTASKASNLISASTFSLNIKERASDCKFLASD